MTRFSISGFRLPIGAHRAPLATRHLPLPLHTNSSAFSLVEVTLALGIVSFALVAVIGLLPVGLKSIKNANEQAGAANVLNAIAGSLRTASSTNASNFFGRFADRDIQYAVGGSASSFVWSNLTLEGTQEDASGNPPKRLSARLEILQAPANLSTPGRAIVSVAWSAQANPGWDSTANRWTGADGSITSGIQFLPRQ
jgi:type II secretory pathway pseudopilin PulG